MALTPAQTLECEAFVLKAANDLARLMKEAYEKFTADYPELRSYHVPQNPQYVVVRGGPGGYAVAAGYFTEAAPQLTNGTFAPPEFEHLYPLLQERVP